MLMNYWLIISIIIDNKNNNTRSIENATEVPICSTMVHRSTIISPERILNSPIKTRLREAHACEIKSLKRKLCLYNYNKKKKNTEKTSIIEERFKKPAEIKPYIIRRRQDITTFRKRYERINYMSNKKTKFVLEYIRIIYGNCFIIALLFT